MTDLERQCEEIERKAYTGTISNGERVYARLDGQEASILLAYVSQLKAEFAELRRPSEANEIAQIQRRHESGWFQLGENSLAGHAAAILSEMKPAITKLLHALAESQRDNARYANAHAVNMARADAAEKRVRDLEDTLAHIAKHADDPVTREISAAALASPLPAETADAARIAELTSQKESMHGAMGAQIDRLQRALEWILWNGAFLAPSGEVLNGNDETLEVPAEFAEIIRPAREE